MFLPAANELKDFNVCKVHGGAKHTAKQDNTWQAQVKETFIDLQQIQNCYARMLYHLLYHSGN